MIRIYCSWKSKISISKYSNIYIWVSINDNPYSMNSGYLLFFETTIIGNTADLAMVQKTIIDTLHKEGKSQRVIAERCAVQGVLYQSILNAKLTGRKKLGRKRCTSNRDDCKLENTVKQSWFKHLGELHKELIEAGFKSPHAQTSSGKGLPSHLWKRNNVRSILPGLRWKELDCWSVVQSPLFRLK